MPQAPSPSATEPIAIGGRIPSTRLRRLKDGKVIDYLTISLFAGKKVLMVGFPGAFTPICSGKHLPDFLDAADRLEAMGIDLIIGIAVNDPWVMAVWEQHHRVEDRILILSDGNADFTKGIGMAFEAPELGVGLRCNRFLMLAVNGIVRKFNYERGMAISCTSTDDAMDFMSVSWPV